MGSAASSKSNVEPHPENPLDERKQMLLQRKVTVDILENLARKLPLVRNPLGDDLKLNKDSRHALEWKENLNYLKEWKKGKKDDATIGNLIEILKKSGHTADEYECLFNISRDPCNASTATEKLHLINDHTMSGLLDHMQVHHPTQCSRTKSSVDISHFPVGLPQDFNFISSNLHCKANPIHNKEVIQPSPIKNHAQNSIYEPNNGPCLFEESTLRTPHHWVDFRNFQQIRTMIPFISNSSRNLQVGNYLPGIACSGRTVFASDASQRCIHLFSKRGELTQSLSTREYIPGGLCQTREENLAVCCGRVVALWDREGRVNGHFGDGFFTWCRGICCDVNNRLIVADTGKQSVTVHDNGGRVITELCLPQDKKYGKPYHVTSNYKGDIFVSDSLHHSVYAFDKSGVFIQEFAKSNPDKNLDMPMGVVSDCAGNVLISNYGNRSIDLYNNDGWYLNQLVGGRYLTHRPVTMSLFGHKKLLVSMMKESPLHLMEFT